MVGKVATPIAQRLAANSEQRDECIVWTGTTNRNGYGVIGIGSKANGTNRTALVHRVSYEEQTGEKLGRRVLRHRCDNPPCFKLSHLLPGTQTENIADMVERNRQPLGEKSGTAKITADTVAKIRARVAAGESRSSVARSVEISRSQVSMIASRKRWPHV